MPATVQRLEYDPNRSAFIALVRYEDGEISYILAPQRLAEGDVVVAGEQVDVKPGNAMPLASMPVGTIVHNVELKIGQRRPDGALGGHLCAVRRPRPGLRDPAPGLGRAAARARQLHGDGRRGVQPRPRQHHIGKAGRNRWLGWRPSVRGVAMNPVDHPHGGGEGRTSGGRHPVTPWGKPTKGKKTRTNKATTKYILRSRHARKGR